MQLSTLFRGICRRTPNLFPPTDLRPPDRVTLPLRQHQGPACEPSVEPGQKVLRGQVVGESKDPASALVHASISGTVEEITE
ncbi:MAG: hypothetical protein PVG60_03500, partial [Desulfarculaceae bacterium]